MSSATTIAIIGAGNMGTCLLKGLIANGYPAQKLWISNPTLEKLSSLKQHCDIHISTDNTEAVNTADVVIFAVKPAVIPKVAKSLASVIQLRKPLVISIAAGMREETIQHCLGGKIPIVRCMPNTPAMIGCGASALFANSLVSHEQHNLAESILRAVGITVWIKDENLMNAVTALSGCGPAYFFLVIEILQNAAEKLGLPHDVARLLTLQTAYGASRMALECDHNVVDLRKQVTSPGGTTEQAIRVLQEKNISDIFFHALQAAKQRGEELEVNTK